MSLLTCLLQHGELLRPQLLQQAWLPKHPVPAAHGVPASRFCITCGILASGSCNTGGFCARELHNCLLLQCPTPEGHNGQQHSPPVASPGILLRWLEAAGLCHPMTIVLPVSIRYGFQAWRQREETPHKSSASTLERRLLLMAPICMLSTLIPCYNWYFFP